MEKCTKCGQYLFGADVGKGVQDLIHQLEREIGQLQRQVQEQQEKEHFEALKQQELAGGGELIGTTRASVRARAPAAALEPTPAPEPAPAPAPGPPRAEPAHRAGMRATHSGASGGTAVSVHESVTPPSRRERAGSFSREHLDRLESMGFEPAAAREALEQARGNMQHAVALLTRQAAR